MPKCNGHMCNFPSQYYCERLDCSGPKPYFCMECQDNHDHRAIRIDKLCNEAHATFNVVYNRLEELNDKTKENMDN